MHRGEGRPALAAAWLLFILLTSLMLLRPVREALGLARGIENVRRLFLVTVLCTVPLVPLFGWLVARCPRRKLMGVSLRVCAGLLAAFFVGLTVLPEPARNLVAAVYYVFHSVFNLFVISLFWAFMADHFSLAESKRLFPAIALGGSVGAIAGSLVSWQLVRTLGVNTLFLLAAVLLEVAVFAASCFCHVREPTEEPSGNNRPIGGSWLEGFESLSRSSYLRGIGLYEVLIGVASTFLYFTSLKLVAAATDSTAQQTSLFAHINLWTQLATLAAQAFLAARVMRFAGVGAALALLPLLAIGGFTLLAVIPTLLVFTLVNALFRAVQQGVSGPAQQTLFTVLTREDKYKAKALLDTVGYRAGDALGAYAERLLGMLGPGLYPLAGAVLGLSGLWLVLCRFLGRRQAGLAIAPLDRSSSST